jgi:hypothetical protein
MGTLAGMQRHPDSSGERHTDPWGWTTDAAGNPVPPPAPDAKTPAAAAPPAGATATTEATAATVDGGADADGGGLRRRSRAHASGGWGSSRRLALIGAGALVLLGGIGYGGYVLASGKSANPSASRTTTTKPAPPTSVVPVTVPVRHVPTCPLTDLPAPGGVVPQRPVLAVKVGNDPNARPQSGLQNADIVFDTLAEGGITRYIAVYQCGNSDAIGPIRSVRWDDWHILQMFGHADLAFVNGINPDIDTVAGLPWICDLDEFENSGAYYQNPDRYAPESTYSSTSALWAACPKGAAPSPIFQYSNKIPAGSGPMASTEINYSFEGDVIWRWSAANHAFLHFYRQESGIMPDVDAAGQQLEAANVVIELVNIEYGPYPESPGGTGDVEAQLTGRGTAYVLRGGRVEKGTWTHASWTTAPLLTSSDGKPMTLQPGNTWVEIVPVSDTITFTP